MKFSLLIFFLSFLGNLSWAQGLSNDTAFYIHDLHVFAQKCIYKTEKKYQVKIFAIPEFCYHLPEFSSDRIEKHNQKIEKRYAHRLGDKWQNILRDEIAKCESSICNSDSITKYYRLGYLLLTPQSDSLNETQKCLLINSVDWLFEMDSAFKLEIQLYSLASEDSLNLSRIRSISAFLKDKNIRESSFIIIDQRSSNPLFPNSPNNPENCRLSIKLRRD